MEYVNYIAAPGLLVGYLVPTYHRTPIIIVNTVAEFFGLTADQLQSRSRLRELVEARMVAALMLKEFAGATLKAIGDLLGGRDHTTTIHYLTTVKDLMQTDPEFEKKVQAVRRML